MGCSGKPGPVSAALIFWTPVKASAQLFRFYHIDKRAGINIFYSRDKTVYFVGGNDGIKHNPVGLLVLTFAGKRGCRMVCLFPDKVVNFIGPGSVLFCTKNGNPKKLRQNHVILYTTKN
jgi:hypothetical protein